MGLLKRTLLAAGVAAAAGIAAAAIFSVKENDDKSDSSDDEVNFINIADANDKEEDVAKKPQKFEQKKPESDEEKEYSPEINEISELYPFLTKPFIEEQFNRNDAFNAQYPEDTLITITHKAKFEEAKVLGEFLAIAEANGFSGTALNDTEGTVTKKMFTEDGAILSDIYNVSNQAACLHGTYEGYSIV
ncbi:MAG: hypothetical protein EOM64_02280 [Erysipelotrichia bacterium]|nr:hypothetical protein [Erysipelotrichia bacterium]